jgi:hypothetical protein
MAEQDDAHVRPALWMTALIVAAWIAGTIWSRGSMMPQGAPLPPSLLLLLPLSSTVALLVGFRAAHLAFIVCLVVFAIYWRARPAMGPLETTAHVNFLLALLTLQIFVWGFHVTFRRLDLLLGAQQRIIGLRLEEHARLVNTLVSDIKSCLTAMRPHFDATRLIAPKSLHTEQSSLTEILRKAQAFQRPRGGGLEPGGGGVRRLARRSAGSSLQPRRSRESFLPS